MNKDAKVNRKGSSRLPLAVLGRLVAGFARMAAILLRASTTEIAGLGVDDIRPLALRLLLWSGCLRRRPRGDAE